MAEALRCQWSGLYIVILSIRCLLWTCIIRVVTTSRIYSHIGRKMLVTFPPSKSGLDLYADFAGWQVDRRWRTQSPDGCIEIASVSCQCAWDHCLTHSLFDAFFQDNGRWRVTAVDLLSVNNLKGTLRRRIAYIFFGPPGKYILWDIFL